MGAGLPMTALEEHTFRTVKSIGERLGRAAAELRAELGAAGIDLQDAYRSDHIRLPLGARHITLIADQLTEAKDVLHEVALREQELESRIAQLGLANGVLMVDRDRGIREAGARAEGAWQVAADSVAALRAHGLEAGADLEVLVADATRYSNHMFALMNGERMRLEQFRMSMVALIGQALVHAGSGKGLTADQVGKLGQHVERANTAALRSGGPR